VHRQSERVILSPQAKNLVSQKLTHFAAEMLQVRSSARHAHHGAILAMTLMSVADKEQLSC
jgi:hypothetical protein